MENTIKKLVTFILLVAMVITMVPLDTYAIEKEKSIDDGIYYINTKSGNRIDIKKGSYDNGAIAHIWEKADVSSQYFVFRKLSDNSYRIDAYHSGLSLEVSNSSLKNGAQVQQWDYFDNYDCKRWYIKDCGNGWYKFVNKKSGKCLDIENAADKKGTRLQQYEDDGTDAQRFSLTKVNQPVNKFGAYKIGDTINVSGTYYESSVGGKYNQRPGTYVISKIIEDAPFPYAIHPTNDNSIYGWINEESIDIPDYTSEIIRGFIPQNQALIAFKDSHSYLQILTEFYSLYNTGAVCDIKNEKNWNKLFSVPFPGKESKFKFYDMIVTPSQLGNILYGMMGSMVGIGDVTLYCGGGFANGADIKTLLNPKTYYGDMEEDHFDITRGILLTAYQKPIIDVTVKNGDIFLNGDKIPEWVIKAAENMVI